MPHEDPSAGARPRVLLIEGSRKVRLALRRALEGEFLVLEADGPGTAAALPETASAEVILTALEGPALLEASACAPGAALLLLWDGARPFPAAPQAQAAGVLRPSAEPEEIRLRVGEILRRLRLEKEVLRLREDLRRRDDLSSLLGSSPVMERLRRNIRRIAGESGTVLLFGEKGSGRGRTARAIHAGSPLKDGPFVSLSPGAFPAGRRESELLGPDGRGGRLAEAGGGTFYLDGLEDLRSSTRSALFRRLQDEAGAPRLVAACGPLPPGSEPVRGLLRDLAAAGAPARIEIPALRDRRGDIPMLADHFLARAAAAHGLPPRRTSPEALACLESYPWPGNLRELQHLMESLTLLTGRKVISHRDLPAHIRRAPTEHALFMPTIPEEGILWEKQVRSFERGLLEQALTLSDGRKVGAARRLGLKKDQMKYLCRKYGL